MTLKSLSGTSSGATVAGQNEQLQSKAAQLHALAQADEDYFVRVSAIVEPSPNTEDRAPQYAQSFVSACAYYSSGMTDSIAIHVDAAGNPQSLSIATPAKCKPSTKKKKITKVKTHATIKRGDPGPVPFLDTVIAEAKKRQQNGDEENKGFLQKYWMYILPVYLIILLNSVGGDEGGAGGGEAGAGGGSGGNGGAG